LNNGFAGNLSHLYPDYKTLAEETSKEGSSYLKGHFASNSVNI
jgi:hypothetical protein